MAAHKATDNELEELFIAIREYKKNGINQGILEQLLRDTHADDTIDEQKWNPILQSILNRRANTVRRVHFVKTAWFRYAAAILFLIAGTALYLYKINQPSKEMAQQTSQTQVITEPNRHKAILTLADGRTIVLDSSADKALARRNNINILKLDASSLAFNNHSGIASETGQHLYNTISTPRGLLYQITLPDGTKAWLNAASSIKFPVSFAKKRQVTITGEAYFEVAKDAQKPFTVITSKSEVMVLGTSFNVNTYSYESLEKITLLNGSIRVTGATHRQSAILKPGEQANNSKEKLSTTQAALDEVMAWKNGLFRFKQADIKSIMRYLEQWYDIEVIYKDEITVSFVSTIPRTASLASALTTLEQTGGVRFAVEGRKVFVMK